MVFASGLFIFIFLPITLVGNFFLQNKSIVWKNIFLFFMSVGFYLKGGVKEFILLLSSIVINYVLARFMAKYKEKRTIKKIFLLLAILYNIGMLFVFKYFTFIAGQFSQIFSQLDVTLSIALPLGISFYTFQAMSYVIDVYRNPEIVERKLLNVALYISLFPQLVAGPIVRWESIRKNINNRSLASGGVNSGLARFALGLGKKVIIANQMAVFADKSFVLLSGKELTTGFAWLGAIAYTMQIYFDFSGYSDMAIGLGQVLGFEFPENFNYPYIAKSITEFWRRWHISLSTWFRDYVYIPMGGNRCSKVRTFFNLFVVWMLTGIWHGANYTFWLWGFTYFILLVLEKIIADIHIKIGIFGEIIGRIYTLLAVILLWVVFRADSVADAFEYVKIMFCGGASSEYAYGVTSLYIKNAIGYFIIAIIGCMPWMSWLFHKIKIGGRAKEVAYQVWVVGIFVIACCMTIDSNYNPFIYFNF